MVAGYQSLYNHVAVRIFHQSNFWISHIILLSTKQECTQHTWNIWAWNHGLMCFFQLGDLAPHGTGWPGAINLGQSCEVKVVFFSISEWPGQSGSPMTHIAWWNDERIWSSQGALKHPDSCPVSLEIMGKFCHDLVPPTIWTFHPKFKS